jgi:arylsulfatase A-like enzyme
VLVFADDLGYGDLSSYGHPTIRTPNLDGLAREGMRLTSFYAGAPVCTPSRAALLTGRYSPRSGMTRVIFPGAPAGLPHEEITLAEVLRDEGYRTAAIGKWHLGDSPAFLPTAHGFDSYFGIPYSNDMDRGSYPPTPLIRDTVVVEQPMDQTTMTRRYTDEALRFIRASRDGPFFLYLAHSMPHLPLYASSEFLGRSRAGLYGDVIEELDWSVGQILEELRRLDLERNTLVIFTSDNGPWTYYPVDAMRAAYGTLPSHVGSAGPLRGAKATTWEGGLRVPMIARWPGKIPAGSESAEMASVLDLYTTLIEAAGGTVPSDRVIDGRDLLPMLTGGAASPVSEFFYFRDEQLEAIREGRWKLRLSGHAPGGVVGAAAAETGPTPQLFDLEIDPAERIDRAAEEAEVVARLLRRMTAFADETGTRTVPLSQPPE